MSADGWNFELIVRTCQGPLRSYLAGMGVPAYAVDDVSQEVFLAYYRKPEARPAEVEPLRWLKGIARRQALDWYRRQAGHNQRAALFALVEARLPEEPERGEDERRLEALRRCLGGISGDARALLDAHYGDHESTEAIARRRSLGASTIRMALLRLREQLRQCVERRLAREGLR